MADAKHCAVHTGYVPACIDCNLANPIQRDIGFDDNVGHDPYNHVGASVFEGIRIHSPLFFQPDNVASIDMGGTVAYINHRINWFNRAAIRFVFGWKAQNL